MVPSISARDPADDADARRHVAHRLSYEQDDEDVRESQPLKGAVDGGFLQRMDEEEQDSGSDTLGNDNEGDDADDHDKHMSHELHRQRQGAQLRGGVVRQVWHIAREALPILVLALFSLMLSGELLIHLSKWPVFVKVNKLFIAVPILLNMKGNLEMNLSLRLSTSANIGELDTRRTRRALVGGNLALLQVQALIVSTLAGCLACVLGVLLPEEPPATAPSSLQSSPPAAGSIQLFVLLVKSATQQLRRRRILHGHPKPPQDPALKLRNGYFEFVMVIATGTLAASLSSAILGSFVCALVIISRRFGVNPDNVASPLAASLGDLLTLVLMGLLGSALVRVEGTLLATLILAALVGACGLFGKIAWRNEYVKQLLSSGWTPLILAMFISSGAGMVLDSFVQELDGFALLAPVITGLPGACTAIFASRISTALHASDVHHARAHHRERRHGSRLAFWLAPTENWLVPVALATLGIGIATAFIALVWSSGQLAFGWQFGVCFVGFMSATVVFALALSHVVCLYLWTRDYDPDIYCLPYVSSIVDVVGQLMLVGAFKVAAGLGDHISSPLGR